MSVALRPATVADAAALGAILSDWIDETDWMPRLHTRAQDQRFVAGLIDTSSVTVADDGPRPVGFVARRRDEIVALYVAANARRQGIGSALMRAMQSVHPVLTLWTFQANKGAQSFYRSLGFSEIERTDGAGNDEGLPDLRLMWKEGA